MSVGTLTAVPVPPPARVEGPVAGLAMLLAPLVGLLLGAAAAIVVWLAGEIGLSALVAASLAIGVLALATRGLHLDGLADTADGLASSYDRDRALDVMKRGDVGPTGVATVVVVLLVQVAALAQAVEAAGPVTVLVAAVAARVAVPLACARGVPAARPDGLGAAVAESVSRTALVVCVAVTALVCAVLLVDAGIPWAGPAVVAAVVAVAWLLLWLARHRLGGVTGDVIGGCVELATAAALVTLAALT
jgi:adenosylcobinamide-GDP ribazoletransferase